MAEAFSSAAPFAGLGVLLFSGYKIYESMQPPTVADRSKPEKRSNAPKKSKKEPTTTSTQVHAKGTKPGAANPDKQKKKVSFQPP